MPVIVVFCPRVMDEGEKDVILVFVPAPPQSFQVNDKSVAAAEATRAAAAVAFMLIEYYQGRSSKLTCRYQRLLTMQTNHT